MSARDPKRMGKDKASRASRGGGVTLEDVAARAGVSTATVSRYLNAPERVNEKSREKVRSAIAALRYVPHAAARALASRRSRLVGAVIPTAAHSIFGGFIQALEDALFAGGYALLLGNSHHEPEREAQQAEHLMTLGVDAMVLVGSTRPQSLYGRLRETETPYVNTYVYAPDDPHPCVGFDNAESAARVVQHLVALGHRRFAMIAGLTGHTDRAARRLFGVKEGLRRSGLPLPAERILERPYDIAEGRAAMGQLMSCHPRPTAVICGNDILAFGALFECRGLGIAVPEEVSITGFDDLEIAAQMLPPLTTVGVPAEAMGHGAARYLLAAMAGKGEEVPRKTELEAHLRVRGTTGRPP